MKKLIYLLLITLCFVNVSAIDFHYQINISQKGNNISIEKFGIEIGEVQESFGGELIVQVFSDINEKLYENYFTMIKTVIIEGDLGEGYFDSAIVQYNLTEIILFIPYFENAKEIIIYDENLIERDRIDVSMYSKEYKKDLIEEELVEEEVILEEESSKADEEKIDYIEKIENYWWILVIILIFLILKLVWDLSSKKQK